MEEIDLGELFKYFIRKWYIIFILVITSILFGTVYTLVLKTPMYNSSTTLVLAISASETQTYDQTGGESITQNDILLNQKLVSTYREIIKSRKILGQTIQELNLKESISELRKLITVSSIDDTELIEIKVSYVDSLNAMIIANEVAEIFSKEIVDIYNIQNVKIIDYAEMETEPYNVNIIKEEIIYILIGLVLGVALVFILFYFDTTIKSVEEVENKIKLPILGAVPNRTKSRKKSA